MFFSIRAGKAPSVSIAQVTSGSSHSMMVQWKSSGDCDGYSLQYSSNEDFGGDTGTVQIDDSSQTEVKIDQVEPGTTYYLRIRSYVSGNSVVKKKFSKWTDTETVETPSSVVMMASDYQSQGTDPKSNLASILRKSVSQGIQADNFIFCGDYTAAEGTNGYGGNPDDTISDISDLIRKQFSEISQKDMIFVQGNHDSEGKSISENGLHYFDDYIVYVLNTQSMNPTHQGVEGEEQTLINSGKKIKKDLGKLASDGETRPVIVATHVPLHFTSRSANKNGDNIYSRYIFEALNEVADELDIIYVYGHNHSDGYDNYLGGSSIFRPSGSTILIPKIGNGINTTEFEEETLKFSYMNAGYVGYADYRMNNKIMTCSVLMIYPDKIKVIRYDRDGVTELGGAGSKEGSLIPSKYNVEPVETSEISKCAH